MKNFLSYLSLFTSIGTLFCCALPALFVLLGAGVAFAGFSALFPQLEWIVEHKNIIFIFAALIISLNGFLLYKNRNAPCPIDPTLAKACTNARKVGKIVFYFSLIFFLTGFFFAYLLPIFYS
ncbi:MAG: hypothetical protein K0R25_171 [Rickettsiaceae bacterium]|jgi:hypothetical protein|nr:hypothetical protein [Rickettsiaceae bacterium]